MLLMNEIMRRRIAFALLMLLAVATIAVAGYRLIGGPSVTLLQAAYMAVITLSGVGYTEVVDTSHNPALRLFNIFVVLFGVAIAVYVFSVFTAFIVEGELRHLFRRGRMRKKINQLSEHFIICGLGETGRHVVEELHKSGTEYVVIELSEEVLFGFASICRDDYSDMLYVIGDATDENVLQEAGINRAGGLIACLAADKDNLVITVLVRQQNPYIRIESRHKEMSFSERILKAGANSTVSPNQIGGMRLASEVLRPHVVSFLDLMLQEKSRTLRIEQVEVPSHSPWVGLTLNKLQLNAKHNILLLALKDSLDPAHELHVNPPENAVIVPGAVLIAMGDVNDLRRVRAEAETV